MMHPVCARLKLHQAVNTPIRRSGFEYVVPGSPIFFSLRKESALRSLTMDVLPKPEVICTHEIDLDGLVSGVLLQRLAVKLFGEEPRLEAYHNHNWRQRALSEKSAWVTDLTFEPRLDRPNWLIVDHHVTET